MDIPNERWFNMQDALRVAQGYNYCAEIIGSDGKSAASIRNGGIRNPTRTLLQSGTCLIRYGGAGLPHMAVRGCWYIDIIEYGRVEAYAKTVGLSVHAAMRLLCAIPLEWSTMDIVIQVRLKKQLLAFSGVGSPVIVRNKNGQVSGFLDCLEGDVSAPRITQVYIPGLGNDDIQHDALMVEGYGHISQAVSRGGYTVRADG